MAEESEDERWERLSRDRQERPLPRRFYNVVTISDRNGILLDGRAVKTPLKKSLEAPTRALAEAMASEWEAQEKVINPALMPITKLANTAIDRAGPERQHVAGEVEAFLGSDLVCYRAGEPEGLVALQQKHWDPVIAWAQFKAVTGIAHIAQPLGALERAKDRVRRLSDCELTAIHNLTTLTGSALIALMLADGALTADEAWAAAHVDEDFQIGEWGEDFEAADRRANRRIDFDATVRFLNLLNTPP